MAHSFKVGDKVSMLSKDKMLEVYKGRGGLQEFTDTYCDLEDTSLSKFFGLAGVVVKSDQHTLRVEFPGHTTNALLYPFELAIRVNTIDLKRLYDA